MTVFANENVEEAMPVEGVETYTNASQMAIFTFKGYNNGTIPAPTTTLGLLEYTLKTFVMGDDYNGPIGISKTVWRKRSISWHCPEQN